MYIFVFLWTPALKTSEEEVSCHAATPLHASFRYEQPPPPSPLIAYPPRF